MEEVCADCVCIGSSAPDGSAYINTASLDGENAPKSRKAMMEMVKLKTPDQLAAVKGLVKCPENFKDLEGFSGVLELHDKQPNTEIQDLVNTKDPIGIDDSHFYYRGSFVSTVEYVYLLVLFVGRDTKMILNRNQVPFKFSRFERTLNRCVAGLLIVNIIFVFALS
eukprot:UN33471